MKLRGISLALLLIFSVNCASAACYINQKEVDCSYFLKTWGWFFIAAVALLIGWTIFVFRMILDGYRKMAQYPDRFDYKWVLKWAIINVISLGLGALIYYFAVYRKYKNQESQQILAREKAVYDEDSSIAANHFRKLSFPWNWIANIFFLSFVYGYADGGKLIIQDSKLIFKPHSVNFGEGYWETSLRSIESITLRPGANTKVKQMFVRTDSSEDKFIIWESQKQELVEKLKSARIVVNEEQGL